MQFKNLPIKKKLRRFIFLICGAVLLVTCSTFFIYEYYKSMQRLKERVSTFGDIISDNGTAALAFNDEKNAKEILTSLKTDPHIVAACFYDKTGKIFSHYPESADTKTLPARPGLEGYSFSSSYLEGFHSVTQGSAKLGTLFLRSDLDAIYERFFFYLIITIIVIIASLLLAYLLSAILQTSISGPILSLSETAKIISEEKDFSVRAVKLGEDEIGSLTDAFNQMLVQIQEQNQTLNEFNQNLSQKVSERTNELQIANLGLKESEEQIQTIFKSAPNALVVMNEEGNIIRWNQKAEETFGWKAEEVTDKPMHEIIMPLRYRQMHLSGVKKFIETGVGPVLNKTLELAAIRKGNIEFPMEIRISYTRLKNKYVFIAFINDITERKKAETELKQKTDELMHVNKELEQFVYVASHDLQEPLRTISNFAGLFEEEYSDKLDEDTNQYLKFIVDASSRMQNLIKDLLDFSRIGRKIVFEIIDSNKILLEIIAEMGSSIKESNAKIKYPDLPSLKGNAVELKQLFQNLISNAIKFRKKDVPPEIEITAEEKETEYLFSVKDNGIGFEEEYKDKIFIIFQRLHNATEYPGTGIGLATCKKIVTQHNGRIWVESKLGEGSTFYFTISKNL